jgi:hypothetical protein
VLDYIPTYKIILVSVHIPYLFSDRALGAATFLLYLDTLSEVLRYHTLFGDNTFPSCIIIVVLTERSFPLYFPPLKISYVFCRRFRGSIYLLVVLRYYVTTDS